MNTSSTRTSKALFLPAVLCVLLFSCQQAETTENAASTETLVNTSVSAVKPMQVIAPANLRLSFIGRTPTDSSVFYQVQASYQGQSFGFDLSIPKGEEGTAYISGKGKASDDLLHFLQEAYGQPVDTTARFADYVSAAWASLGALVVEDSAGRMGDSVSAGHNRGTQSKLVFGGGKGGAPVEWYLDINETDHWIELEEKDTAFRARLIRALTK